MPAAFILRYEILPSLIDNLVIGLDQALRTLTGQINSERTSPSSPLEEADMDEASRAHVIGLMRVNHAGEICAQALYEGQALMARTDEARQALIDAAQEERDHLAWCRERVEELGGKTSRLDPVFYGASFAIGAATGVIGDKVSLGFVEATEDQVVDHLDRHLEDLPQEDVRSRARLEQMREDEARHGDHALALGGEEFPRPVKAAMMVISRLMTETAYRI